ncbi:hypothetical protein AQUCO_00500113v1 [Aquilegia coerulea]|uniref:Glutamate receptor n=1 Tax=Aquilegia coerulea TaxID=218851 RepID=A0A2G5EQP3_AQUCA|nr:hypothetical protein AQUCO_00500113v1 [Aquilegia coerulea]
MSLPVFTGPTISFLSKLFCVFSLFSLLFHGVPISGQYDITNIGAIINLSSRVGKEEKLAMELAVEIYNNTSSNRKFQLHVSDSGGDPLQAYTGAENLISLKQVDAIINMDEGKEAGLVTELANRAQVPILSFTATSITPQLASVRWPFLIRMANNDSLQMQCIASIVGSYGWHRVIVIYEDGGYNTDLGTLTLLSDELQAVGSEIEHSLAFPPFSTLSDPKTFIQEKLETLYSINSRVFIVLPSSLELAIHISTEAMHLDFMGKDSVWIMTDSITSLLHTVNSSAMSSMEGIIGIKTYFSNTNPLLVSFLINFRYHFQLEYPEEENSEPGIYAILAYDAVSSVALAIQKSGNNRSNTTSRKLFLENILSSNFSGLSGEIRFEDNELSRLTTYEIVNVDHRRSLNTLKFWSLECEFSEDVNEETCQEKLKISGGGATGGHPVPVLGGRVYWSGGLERVPLGWKMPSEAEPLVIGIPGNATFEKFVRVGVGEPSGYCIDVFRKALEKLNYDLPHKFESFIGEYDALVQEVYSEKFGAVVGDVTILDNRSNFVDFTQPYAESALTMVVRVKQENRTWLFVLPFNRDLWIVAIFAFVYTMFVVWFLEHRSNPEFRGPWKNQLGTAMWVTFTTLFLSHREGLRNNFTRIVMFVWLFAVFVLTSSYTASLTSMLTVQRLEPKFSSIETLRRSNKKVGCDADSFVKKYVEQVLHFHPNNIISVKSEYDYPEFFNNGTIEAAFVELPYEKVFLDRNGRAGYIDGGVKHRFGGFGFAFPKGSPMARDFSRAFLKLSEDGTLNKLEEYWFPSSSCSNPSSNSQCPSPDSDDRLSLKNFWTLFLVTSLTSTIMLVFYIVDLIKTFRLIPPPGTTSGMDDSLWNGMKRFGMYYNEGRLDQSRKGPFSSPEGNVEMFISSDGGYLSGNTPRLGQSTPSTDIQMPKIYSNTQKRVLRLAYSFPS